MGAADISRFLTWLAVERHVSASTQNQALSSLLFLYKDVLGIDIGSLADVPRARPPVRVPVVSAVTAAVGWSGRGRYSPRRWRANRARRHR